MLDPRAAATDRTEMLVSCGPHCTQTLGGSRWAAEHLGPFVTDLEGLTQYCPSHPFASSQQTRAEDFLKTSRTWQRNTRASIHTPMSPIEQKLFYHSKATWHTIKTPFLSPWEQDEYYHSHLTNRGRGFSTSTEHPEQGSMPGRDPKAALQLLKTSWAWWQMVLSIVQFGHHTHGTTIRFKASLGLYLFLLLGLVLSFLHSTYLIPLSPLMTLSQIHTNFKHTDYMDFLQNFGWKKCSLEKPYDLLTWLLQCPPALSIW